MQSWLYDRGSTFQTNINDNQLYKTNDQFDSGYVAIVIVL